MAVLDFPKDPNIGDTYEANGVRYTWEGVQWTARNSGDYVEKSGDNMTGDLTLGIDKIVLDATDGSAKFKGTVQAENADGSTFSYMGTNGTVSGTGNCNFGLKGTFGTSIEVGSTPQFYGALIYNDSDINGAASTLYLRNAKSAGYSLYVENASNGTAAATITGNGSAEFADQVTVGSGSNSMYGLVAYNNSSPGSATVFARNYAAGGRIFQGASSGGSTTVEIFEDGSATFAKDLVSLSPSGNIRAFGYTAKRTSGEAFRVDNNGTDTVSILADGQANFANNIKSGILNTNSSTTTGVNCYYSGEIYQQCLGSASDSLEVYRIYKGTTRVYSIRANGAAAFSNTVTASNLLFNLEPENLSHYRTTTETYEVDGEEQTTETQDYIGPVLDVKDTLLRYETTLKSVKQAVEEAQDFPTLKEALLKALTKI